MRYRLATVLLASVVVSIGAFGHPVHADRLYWAITHGDTTPGLEGFVESVRTDGTGLVELYECMDWNVWLGSVAVDSVSRRLYWAEHNHEDSTDAIVRADGNGCQMLQTVDGVLSIALDTSGGKIYWTEDDIGTADRKIKRANLDFSSVELLLDGLNWPRNIELDPNHGKMYWYDNHDSTVMRSNLDGSNVETMFVDTDLAHFQIDSSGQKIYWTRAWVDGLRRADLDGSNVEELAPQVKGHWVADVGAAVVYWQWGNMWGPPAELWRANLDGSDAVVLLERETGSLELDPSDEAIPINCPSDVPAMGYRGAVVLVVLLLVAGIPAVLRTTP
jgi:hypothetical protein